MIIDFLPDYHLFFWPDDDSAKGQGIRVMAFTSILSIIIHYNQVKTLFQGKPTQTINLDAACLLYLYGRFMMPLTAPYVLVTLGVHFPLTSYCWSSIRYNISKWGLL